MDNNIQKIEIENENVFASKEESPQEESDEKEKPKIQPLKREDPDILFYLDETIVIKGNTFKVRKITKKDLILRLEPTRQQ